eukprot:TRINITY_DN1332_c0_g1_i1.p1 TRINITY_DN1332_c0_g1~~TRINITY_DN1332_c0_g1_i1.p1  ORF type:complete len:170 (+),score=30.99 TRINITY_DN1332_c0_g1_i1:659-1168(+)
MIRSLVAAGLASKNQQNQLCLRAQQENYNLADQTETFLSNFTPLGDVHAKIREYEQVTALKAQSRHTRILSEGIVKEIQASCAELEADCQKKYPHLEPIARCARQALVDIACFFRAKLNDKGFGEVKKYEDHVSGLLEKSSLMDPAVGLDAAEIKEFLVVWEEASKVKA